MEWLPENADSENRHTKHAAGDAKFQNRLDSISRKSTITGDRCSFGHRKNMALPEKEKVTTKFNYDISPACTRFGKNNGPSFSFGQKFTYPDQRASSSQQDRKLSSAKNQRSFTQVKRSQVNGAILVGRNWVNPKAPNTNPGPGSYDIPSTLGKGPTIKFKQPISRDVDQGVLNQRMEGPGPAHYDVTPVEVTKKGAPAYGLRGKCKSPKNNMQDIPAPNKYKVPNTLSTMKSSPCFTFGTRHNPKSFGVISKEDKAWSFNP